MVGTNSNQSETASRLQSRPLDWPRTPWRTVRSAPQTFARRVSRLGMASAATVINNLQKSPDRIRNVCILAHVDHGKTTLSDHLVSSNGIISTRIAGQVRYMDSRPDEQERCITMKSSSISLLYNHDAHDGSPRQPHLVNLIDSPGHIDFSSEVSTATRLCDGALVLVDVVEGIQIQTQSVLRQAWMEGVRPCLVLNKMDRLIVELKKTPLEAYHRCCQVIEHANALVSTFHTADLMKRADQTVLADDYDDQIVFSPSAGNVIFASAADCWALSITDAARFYARLLGMNASALAKALWGEFYYHSKTKTVTKKPTGAAVQPMFAQFVLSNIWQAYDCLMTSPVDNDKVKKLVSTLSVNVPQRDLLSTDARQRLQAVMRAWYPIAPCVLGLCVTSLPSPRDAARHRLSKVWLGAVAGPVLDAAAACSNGDDDPALVFVAKMVAVSPEQLTGRTEMVRRPYVRGGLEAGHPADCTEQVVDNTTTGDAVGEEPERRQRFVGLARVFSGVLRPDRDIYAFLPRYDGKADVETESAHDDGNRVLFRAGSLRLFTFMGTELDPIDAAYAGHVVGIAGLEDDVLSAATLCTEPRIAPFSLMTFASSPIVRVAIEPCRTADLQPLASSLRLLAHADPNVDIVFHQSGEMHLVASGELHLERCLRDLKDRFAVGIAFRVSPPVVSFRETCSTLGTGESGSIRVTVRPLPRALTALLNDNPFIVADLSRGRTSINADGHTTFVEQCKAMLSEDDQWASDDFDRIVTFRGSNALLLSPSVDNLPNYVKMSLASGFQMAVQCGTLCDEPMMGVAVIIDEASLDDAQTGDAARTLMLSCRSAIHEAFSAASPRLMEAMYKVQLQCTAGQLGNLCNVLSRRRGRTVRDEMIEGTDLFEVEAFVPVAGSIGLSQELRSKTSGSATPQLLFSHWDVIDMDPDWVPTTPEEIEEFGRDAHVANFARKLVDGVRRRKGLHVKEHIVEHAEKQSTARHC